VIRGRLRVAFFAMASDDKMSARIFCMWPVAHAAERGLEAQYFGRSGPGLYERMNQKAGRLAALCRGIYWYGYVPPRRLWQIFREWSFERSRLVRTVELETTTVDAVLSELPTTYDFLKIDVQGAELKILEGAEDFLRNDWDFRGGLPDPSLQGSGPAS
jgi:Methyltransferase FkbM domain